MAIDGSTFIEHRNMAVYKEKIGHTRIQSDSHGGRQGDIGGTSLRKTQEPPFEPVIDDNFVDQVTTIKKSVRFDASATGDNQQE